MLTGEPVDHFTEMQTRNIKIITYHVLTFFTHEVHLHHVTRLAQNKQNVEVNVVLPNKGTDVGRHCSVLLRDKKQSLHLDQSPTIVTLF